MGDPAGNEFVLDDIIVGIDPSEVMVTFTGDSNDDVIDIHYVDGVIDSIGYSGDGATIDGFELRRGRDGNTDLELLNELANRL